MPTLIKSRATDSFDTLALIAAPTTSPGIDGEPERTGILLTREFLSSYRITDTDTASDPLYLGYSSSSGAWYIVENNTASGTFRYVTGASGYLAAWTGRAGQIYDYIFNVLFQE